MLIAALFLMAGCASAKDNPTTLSKLYSGNLEKVTKVNIVDGGTGEEKEFIEAADIQPWIEQVQHIVLKPHPNQEERDGFRYAITMYEGNKQMLSFSLGKIGKTYYVVDQDMLDLTVQLWSNHK